MVVRLGIGSSQSAWELSALGVLSKLKGGGDPIWEESVERLSAVVWDSVPTSADIRINSGAAWRAPPPFDVLRMAA